MLGRQQTNKVPELLELGLVAIPLNAEGLAQVAHHCIAKIVVDLRSELAHATDPGPTTAGGRRGSRPVATKKGGGKHAKKQSPARRSRDTSCDSLEGQSRRNAPVLKSESATSCNSLDSDFGYFEDGPQGENEYSRLIHTVNAPIFGVDVDGNLTVWNKCAAKKSGYRSQETMGHNLVNEFIAEEFRASVQEVLEKALRGEETANFELPLMTKDGRRLELLLNATCRKDASGNIIGVVGIGQVIGIGTKYLI